MTDSGYTRKQRSSEGSSSTVTNTDSYIFDIGEHPVTDNNKERFRKTWPASRPEYAGHSFKITIDGKEHNIEIPTQVAREIHITAEAESHPITFHQKLQPNYAQGNKYKSVSNVGKLKVQNVCYFNSIQSKLQCPNYFRQKAWAIQKEVFLNHMQFKDIGKAGHPSIMDMDYSSQVLEHMKTMIAPKKQRASVTHKLSCGGSRFLENKSLFNEVLQTLPAIDSFVPLVLTSSSDSDDMSSSEEQEVVAKQNTRRGKDKIKKKKLTRKEKKKVTFRSEKEKEKEKDTTVATRRMATRNSPSPAKNLSPARGEDTITGVDSKGKKRRLNMEETADAEGNEDPEAPVVFDLFSEVNEKPKKSWDTHPQMEELVESGKKRIEMLGFKSPKQGQKSTLTVQKLAAQNNLTLPPKRDDAETVLVRALAIKRLLQEDPSLKDEYDDSDS